MIWNKIFFIFLSQPNQTLSTMTTLDLPRLQDLQELYNGEGILEDMEMVHQIDTSINNLDAGDADELICLAIKDLDHLLGWEFASLPTVAEEKTPFSGASEIEPEGSQDRHVIAYSVAEKKVDSAVKPKTTTSRHCQHCGSSLRTSSELLRHVRYRHTHEKRHQCTQCDYASVELSKLQRHMRSHTGEKPYQCSLCTYAAADNFKLKRHFRTHTGEKPYECDICHSRFTQSNSLKEHKLSHNVNKTVLQCHLCPATCSRKQDLRTHIARLHTAQGPLECTICSEFFSDRYALKQHKNIHQSEKCYKCDRCSYASTSPRFLETHMLTRTNEKPHRCDQCDQRFRQKQLLRRHQILHRETNNARPKQGEKSHSCPHCTKVFCHPGNLVRHMALHQTPEETSATTVGVFQSDHGNSAMKLNSNITVIENFHPTTYGSNAKLEIFVVWFPRPLSIRLFFILFVFCSYLKFRM